MMRALKETDGKLIGLIAPHAGYVYSGHVAGYAYKQLMGHSFDTVVLVGLSHRKPNRHRSDLCARRVPHTAWGYPNR